MGRSATADEQKVLMDLYKARSREFEQNPAAAREFLNTGLSSFPADSAVSTHAALTAVTRTLLNLHETITRD